MTLLLPDNTFMLRHPVIMPEFPDGYLYQSFVFEKMGDQAKADKARQAAKSISPDLKIHI